MYDKRHLCKKNFNLYVIGGNFEFPGFKVCDFEACIKIDIKVRVQ